MQTCKFSLKTGDHNIIYLRGITPAELVILRELHFKESNGSPIGGDLQLEPGEALTEEEPAKAAEPEYFHQGTGKTVPAKPAVDAVTHPRTNREEVERLRKRYVSKVPHNPESKGVFNDLFGTSAMVALPTKFEEVLENIGLRDERTGEYLILPADAEISEEDDGGQDLAKKTRPEIITLAQSLRLSVRPTDSKETIIGKIIRAQAKATETAQA